MGHTYTNLMYHIVFSTQERRPWLTGEMKPRLVQMAGGILRDDGGKLLLMNGPADHVHLLALVSPKVAISDAVRDLKAGTSKWVHQEFPGMTDFAWQEGYAAFTVSKSGAQSVLAYIENQEEHHRKKSFSEELIEFLERHEIQYNPEYLL